MSCHLESSDIFSRCHVVLVVGPLAGGERQEVGGYLDNVKELPGVFRHEVVEVIYPDAAWRRLSSRGTCPGGWLSTVSTGTPKWCQTSVMSCERFWRYWFPMPPTTWRGNLSVCLLDDWNGGDGGWPEQTHLNWVCSGRGSSGQSPAMSNGTVSRDLLLDVAAIFKLTTGRRFSIVDSGLEHSLGGWKGNQLHHYGNYPVVMLQINIITLSSSGGTDWSFL